MVWFVRFGQGARAGVRVFDTRPEAVDYARTMRAWARVEGFVNHRVIVGWGWDVEEAG